MPMHFGVCGMVCLVTTVLNMNMLFMLNSLDLFMISSYLDV